MQDPQEGKSIIDKSLSTEIDWHIFSFFGPTHLTRIASVSSAWSALSNERIFWLNILRRERVAFDATKSPKMLYRKLLTLKKVAGEALHDLCKADVDAARMVFSNKTLFDKLTPDQAALMIFGFGRHVLEVAFSLLQVVNLNNKSRMIMHAEEHQETAEFIMQHPELWPLLDFRDLTKIAIHPKISERILQTPEMVARLDSLQIKEIQENAALSSMFKGAKIILNNCN